MIHLDAAAAGRTSRATIQAEVDYLKGESRLGAYVAEAEASTRLQAARATLAELTGPGLEASDVTFHHSASTAFAALISAWPLPPGARVGVVPSEYGSNLFALIARALDADIELVDLPVDNIGIIDLDILDRSGVIGSGPEPLGLEDLDLVAFPPVPSQRGIVQPAAEIGARCAAGEVPLVVDVAQALGQVDVRAIGASAYVGTSRKWLCGPRGVGFLAVRPEVVERLGVSTPNLHNTGLTPDGRLVAFPGVARLGIGEAPVAAAVGLAQALTELIDAGPRHVFARIRRLADHGRRVLDGAGGWQVREAPDSQSGIITLSPPDGLDPTSVRDLLYREYHVLTSAIPQTRSRDLDGPVLRASAHIHTDPADIDHLAAALDEISAASPRPRRSRGAGPVVD